MKRVARTGSFLSPEDIRLKLEGRLEVVERARQSYFTLEKLLRKGPWWRAVSLHRQLLRQVTEEESSVQQALATVHHRAQQEHWPEELPALRLVRQVERLRERLIRRSLACLRDSSLRSQHLAQALQQLDWKAIDVSPLAPGEQILLEADTSLWPWIPLFVWLVGLAFLPILITWIMLRYRRTGRLWITQTRLVWQPLRGPPIQVSLSSLSPGGAGQDPVDSNILKVDLADGSSLSLTFMSNTRELTERLNLITRWKGDSPSLVEFLQSMDKQAINTVIAATAMSDQDNIPGPIGAYPAVWSDQLRSWMPVSARSRDR